MMSTNSDSRDRGKRDDRRRRARLSLAYPLFVTRLSGRPNWLETRTANLSCEGFFCTTEEPFTPNDILECQLLIPGPESRGPHDPGLILHGRAEVVRVENTWPGPFGVACRLSDYRVVHAEGGLLNPSAPDAGIPFR